VRVTTAENPWALSELPAGLVALVGDEGAGKTTWLQRLSGLLPPASGPVPHPDSVWLDLRLPQQDEATPLQVWAQMRTQHPRWNPDLHDDLVQALGLEAHVHKRLNMLSTGSRRKVALAGLLSCSAAITCLDQPYAALDMGSVRVLREFLFDMADHPTRTWVVADYEADPALPWRSVLHLPERR
jgi:ABC-type multidrug transport system ATPase subunit